MTQAIRPRTDWLSFMQELAGALTQTTDNMRRIEGDQAAARAELKELRDYYAGLEADQRLEISLETNGDGKAKYSNEAARTDAARRALSDSRTARDARNRIAASENNLAALDAEHNEQRRIRQNTLALLSYATAYMNLRASDPADEGNDR